MSRKFPRNPYIFYVIQADGTVERHKRSTLPSAMLGFRELRGWMRGDTRTLVIYVPEKIGPWLGRLRKILWFTGARIPDYKWVTTLRVPRLGEFTQGVFSTYRRATQAVDHFCRVYPEAEPMILGMTEDKVLPERRVL